MTYNNLKVSNIHAASEERFANLPSSDPVFRMISEAILSTNSAFLPDDIARRIEESES